MSKVRDNARRNARGVFATERSDGTPVGSYVITYDDFCAEAFDANGECIAGLIGGPSHEPGHHDMTHAFMRGRYRADSFDVDYDDADY